MRRLSLLLIPLFFACQSATGGDPTPLIPPESAAHLILPSLVAFQEDATGFLASIEGTSGLLDLVADRYGLDLRHPNGPRSLGLDPTRPLVAFTLQGSLVFAAGLAQPKTFENNIALQLTRALGATRGSSAGGLTHFQLNDQPLGVGRTQDRLGLIIIGPTEEAIRATWDATAAPRYPAPRLPEGQALASFRVTAPRPQFPPALSLLATPLSESLENLGPFQGELRAHRGAQGGVEYLSLHAHAPVLAPLALGSWLPQKTDNTTMSAAFPLTTPGLLRLTLSFDALRKIPSFIRNRVLPDSLPGLEAMPIPSTASLLDLIDDEIGIAFLGLAPNASLSAFASLGRQPKRIVNLAHLALAFNLRDPAKARRIFGGIASQLESSGWTVAPIAHEDYGGWSFSKQKSHLTVLFKDTLAILLLGPGEAEHFLAIPEGKALGLHALSEDAGGALRKTLGIGPADQLSFVGTSRRITRELDTRGMPPYFLKMLNSIRVVAAGLHLDEEALSIHLEVGL